MTYADGAGELTAKLLKLGDGWSINKKMEIVNRANDIIGRLE